MICTRLLCDSGRQFAFIKIDHFRRYSESTFNPNSPFLHDQKPILLHRASILIDMSSISLGFVVGEAKGT